MEQENEAIITITTAKIYTAFTLSFIESSPFTSIINFSREHYDLCKHNCP
jgi:hypothetical protein